MTELRNKRVLVVGMARTGFAVARRLSQEKAVVTVTDRRHPGAFQSQLSALTAEKIGLELGIHRDQTFLEQDLIVVSPGVPWDLPQLTAAREKGVKILPEVEVATWFLKGTLAAVTGSNGKTTTTTLLGKILEASSLPSLVGGNIGTPLISFANLDTAGLIIVAELSSFQLEAIQDLRPQIAVLLNITPNHLDRHGSFESYVSAKAQVFRNQRPDDFAILNADDPEVARLAPAIASRKVFFSKEKDLPEGVLISKGRILYRTGNLERPLLEVNDVKLRGSFNLENVMAACAAACKLGADFDSIRKVVREFTGVEHRLEEVATVRGVEFFNDSKATSVDATAKALTAFTGGVNLILGGKDKGAPYTPLIPLLPGRVKAVYLTGAAADRIAQDLAGAVEIISSGDLKTAVRQAFLRSVPGDVVLLSPACASYDQFQDFEERGRLFKKFVAELKTATELGLAAGTLRPSSFVPDAASRRTNALGNQTDAAAEVLEAAAETVAGLSGAASLPEPERLMTYEVGAEEVNLELSPAKWENREDTPLAIQTDALRPPEPVEEPAMHFEVVNKPQLAAGHEG
ncbi:MAG TPA: UDP-N-acetylmuramoyl-L-alanine--D-glutamate ligase [Terriglobia bacterium]|nr:UDP-N-acetylmuramoyl-L-alanine--D-glutamate ligase [Terriglobia bacterium]